jgi:hypothetical protein
MHSYEIGTSEGTMANLQSLAEPIEEPRSEYEPYTRIVNLGSGGKRGLGSPRATWNFALLTLEQRNQLKTFCPDASATVYIKTKLNDDTYAVFQATMLWVENEPRWLAGVKQNLQIVFRNMVAV